MNYEEIKRDGNQATVNMKIKNTGNEPIKNWNLKFNFCENEQKISAWNAQVKQSNNIVMLTSDQLGSSIQPNSEERIMLVINISSQNIEMENFLLN